MNEEIAHQVLQMALDKGVREFVMCAGSRNSAFVEALRVSKGIKTFYWPEERSAAFFSLGRSRQTNKPVAIIVTSGSAAAELLPATLEAFYSGVPLLLITADRPQRFRGSGAPQSAEQVGLFGKYVRFAADITKNKACNLSGWDLRGPAHLNVCLEEPQREPKFTGKYPLKLTPTVEELRKVDLQRPIEILDRFISQVERPLVVVSTLKKQSQESVVKFLIELGAPVMLEAISGLREDPRLQSLRIRRIDHVLETAKQCGYPIDGVLRIGGIPTHRLWRDLEFLRDEIKVCGISEQAFSGLSWNRCVACAPIEVLLDQYSLDKCFNRYVSRKWLQHQHEFENKLIELFHEEPQAEASLMHHLSKIIPEASQIYLGNSLPIREWDMAAVSEDKGFKTYASRGINGIDGQISTFLGLCCSQNAHWGVFGDLTTIYDMAGAWILPQLDAKQVNIVVINNGGGMIFEKMYPYSEMLNRHQLNFEPLAKMWGLEYVKWASVPRSIDCKSHRLIELVPDQASNERFNKKLNELKVKMEEEFTTMKALT